MKAIQFIEGIEGLRPINQRLEEIVRFDPAKSGPKKDYNYNDSYFVIALRYRDGEIVTEKSFCFESKRGRDAAYSEIMDGLGRNIVIKIARYQDWTESR